MGISAVAFSGPGLAVTGHLVTGLLLKRKLERSALTVRPANDIVSRIDYQYGGTIPIACDGYPLYCHDLFHSLCSIYATCGSMRPGGNLSFPCGRCREMPCIS